MIAIGVGLIAFSAGWWLRRVHLQYQDRKAEKRIFGDYEDLLEKRRKKLH